MSTVSLSALKVEHNAEAKSSSDFPVGSGTGRFKVNRQLEQTAVYEDAAKPFASSACEVRFVQGFIACLSTGLDDLSEGVSLRLQSARIAAVLRRRR
jgi:hypothetical protein